MSPTYSICKNHGYLAGEQDTCPDCGCKTEVYSRITGYYRPVQNWNDGKLQEFKNRKEYDINLSLNKSDAIKEGTQNISAKVSVSEPVNNVTPEAVKAPETNAASDVNPAYADLFKAAPAANAAPANNAADGTVLLFTTKTCPNCAIAKDYLGDLPYKLIDALEQPDLARKYGVQMAPTLVVDKGDNVVKYVRASEIKKYVDEKKSIYA